MGLDRRKVTIYYKKLHRDEPPVAGATLESSIRLALAARTEDGAAIRDLWRNRKWTDPGDGRNIFMNHHQDDGNLLFGDLVSFTPRRAQALLTNLGDVPEVGVEQMLPDAQSEFMQSMMFWMIRRDHVLVIQSASLRSEAIEKYFRWLLIERTATMPAGTEIQLIDSIQVAEAAEDIPDVRDVVIAGRINMGEAARPRVPVLVGAGAHPPRTDRREVELAEGGEEGWVRSVLRAVLGDDEEVNRALRRVPEGTKLKVSVRMGYERARGDVDRAVLRDLLIAARNLPDSDLKAHTKAGPISGDKIRLTYTADILTIGDLLDQNDVKRAFVSAYRDFIENGRIEP